MHPARSPKTAGTACLRNHWPEEAGSGYGGACPPGRRYRFGKRGVGCVEVSPLKAGNIPKSAQCGWLNRDGGTALSMATGQGGVRVVRSVAGQPAEGSFPDAAGYGNPGTGDGQVPRAGSSASRIWRILASRSTGWTGFMTSSIPSSATSPLPLMKSAV
jgi:hypothetical protein